MNDAPLIGLLLSFCVFIVSVEKLCKIEITKPHESAENEDAEKKNKDNGFLNSLTSLGFGIGAMIFAEFAYMLKNGGIIEPQISLSLFVRDAAIFTLMQIIGFTIFFYIVYGVLSLVNSHNGNETARRNVAGWATVIVNFVCIFIDSQL